MNKRSLLVVAVALLLTALLVGGLVLTTGRIMAKHMDVITTVNPFTV